MMAFLRKSNRHINVYLIKTTEKSAQFRRWGWAQPAPTTPPETRRDTMLCYFWQKQQTTPRCRLSRRIWTVVSAALSPTSTSVWIVVRALTPSSCTMWSRTCLQTAEMIKLDEQWKLNNGRREPPLKFHIASKSGNEFGVAYAAYELLLVTRCSISYV